MTPDLLRLEYKLDLVLHALEAHGIYVPHAAMQFERMDKEICPLCRAEPRIAVAFPDGELLRVCECKPPKNALRGISVAEPPKAQRRKTPLPEEDSEDG